MQAEKKTRSYSEKTITLEGPEKTFQSYLGSLWQPNLALNQPLLHCTFQNPIPNGQSHIEEARAQKFLSVPSVTLGLIFN